MKVCIKNMVCPRCIMVVEKEAQDLALPVKAVELGSIEFSSTPNDGDLKKFEARLVELGFEVLRDNKNKQIEEVKNWLILKLQDGKVEEHFSIKKYLSAKIGKEYSYISKLFSQKEGLTIEQYFILLKLEKVKELITYGEKALNEISWALGYSSVQHLSSQFKRVLGISTTAFKTSLIEKRKSIDEIKPLHKK